MQEPNGTNKIADWQLRQRQAMPMELKVELTKRRIRQWCEHYDDMVYVAFSGGLDSTVLLHIARQVLPDCPAVFHDTGLEYPEIRDFVKTVENVEWTRPKKTFPEVLKRHGYPVVSKRISQYVGDYQRGKDRMEDFGREYRGREGLDDDAEIPDFTTATMTLRKTGIKGNGEYTKLGMVPPSWQFLFDAPFKVSDKCCDYFKKQPARAYEAKTGRSGMVGTRTEESRQRELTYLEYGCNGYDMAVPRSTPLSFWLHADIKQYIKENDITYSKIYDMGYSRTGCMFCMLGCHMEKGKNRFQMMEETHPKLYDYCINKLGLKDILTYIGVNYRNDQLELFPKESGKND